MDTLHFCIALAPLALYFLFIGWLNLGGRPHVLSGYRDAGVLALGVTGLAIAGPLELFFPDSAAFRLGPYAWCLLIALYEMSVILVILSMRPRLVIYNTTIEELSPQVAKVVQEMDEHARWAGNSIVLPECDIQMYMDESLSMRNVQLVASGSAQNGSSWLTLKRQLEAAFEKQAAGGSRNPNAMLFLMIGLMLLVVIIKSVVQDHGVMAGSLHEMLRM